MFDLSGAPSAPLFLYVGFNPERLNQKCPSVGEFFYGFGGGFASAVACACFDADENEVFASMSMLERCGKFEAVGGKDAVVVITCGDECGGIGGAFVCIVIG